MHSTTYLRIRTAVRALVWGGLTVLGYVAFLAACAGYRLGA